MAIKHHIFKDHPHNLVWRKSRIQLDSNLIIKEECNSLHNGHRDRWHACASEAWLRLWNQEQPVVHLVPSPLIMLILSVSWTLVSPWLSMPRMTMCGARPVGAGALSPPPPCVVRGPMCSAHNSSVLLQAGLADYCFQVVKLGEPRSILFQKDLHRTPLFRLQVLLMEQLAVKHIPGHELTCCPGEATCTVDQGQGGEATDEKGPQLHGSGVDILQL